MSDQAVAAEGRHGSAVRLSTPGEAGRPGGAAEVTAAQAVDERVRAVSHLDAVGPEGPVVAGVEHEVSGHSVGEVDGVGSAEVGVGGEQIANHDAVGGGLTARAAGPERAHGDHVAAVEAERQIVQDGLGDGTHVVERRAGQRRAPGREHRQLVARRARHRRPARRETRRRVDLVHVGPAGHAGIEVEHGLGSHVGRARDAVEEAVRDADEDVVLTVAVRVRDDGIAHRKVQVEAPTQSQITGIERVEVAIG